MDPGRLVTLIESVADDDGNWSLPIEATLERLEIDRVAFYRQVYTSRREVETISPDQFGPENLHTLIVGICDDPPACEREVFRRGICFSVADRREISDLYVEETLLRVAAHPIDTETLSGMRRVRGDREAIDLYIDHFWKPKSLIDEVASAFVGRRPEMVGQIAVGTARRVLEELFARHLLSQATLFAGLRERLLAECGIGGQKEAETDPALEGALSDLGLVEMPQDSGDLKRFYRTLMKTYHPDVNPTGLEMSQRITRAYSLVAACMGIA